MTTFIVGLGLVTSMAMQVQPTGVRVLGEVRNPCVVAADGPLGLQAAIRAAGGLLPSADRLRIEVRNTLGASRTFDVSRLGVIPAVRPGDVVIVPRVSSGRHVMVSGAVARGGPIAYREGMTLLDALNESRALNGDKVESIRLVRMEPDGTMTLRTVSLGPLATEAAGAIALQPTDRVEVPYAAQMSDRELLTIAVIGLIVIILVR